MDYQFSTPALGIPVLADTEFRARLKRGFDFAGGNANPATHTFGYILRGTPAGRRIADNLCRPYALLDVDSVNAVATDFDVAASMRVERLFYVGDTVRLNSNPIFLPPAATRRSSSAPACKPQK